MYIIFIIIEMHCCCYYTIQVRPLLASTTHLKIVRARAVHCYDQNNIHNFLLRDKRHHIVNFAFPPTTAFPYLYGSAYVGEAGVLLSDCVVFGCEHFCMRCIQNRGETVV